jgi:hypothetical protein
MKNTWHENIREINKKREATRVSRLACAEGEHEPFHAESILQHFYATHQVEFDVFERASLALEESYASLL